MKHTPGPWKIQGEASNIGEAFVIESESTDGHGVICYTADMLPVEKTEGIIDEECKANAKLIAAAPEMLMRLEEIEMNLKGHPDIHKGNTRVHFAYHMAKAAIAKAKGE